MSIWHDSSSGKWWNSLRLAWLAWALILMGCSGPADQLPRRGGILSYNRPLPDNSLDPWYITSLAEREIAEQIYEGLLQPDTVTFEPVPCLADSWAVEDSGKTFVFRLRKGVRFQDNACFPYGRGREVTIEDVRFSFERNLRGPRTSWGARELYFLKGAEEFRLGRTEHVPGIELRPPRTIVFHLKFPAPHFKYVFYSPAGYVIPKEAVEHYGDLFGQNPVGTGPFRLALWSGDRLMLARNSHYWQADSRGQRLPYLDGVEVLQTVVDAVTWLSGSVPPDLWMEMNADILWNWHRVQGTRSQVIDDSVRMAESAFLVVNFNRNGPLQKAKTLRRSFFSAINVRSVQSRKRGHAPLVRLLPSYFLPGDTTSGMLGATTSFETPKRLPRDIRIQVLNLPVNALSNRNNDPYRQRKLGKFQYRFVKSAQDADIWFVSYQWLYPDAEELLRLFCSDTSPWGYRNEEYDRTFLKFAGQQNPEERLNLAAHLVGTLEKEAVYLPLFEEVNYYCWRPYVKNIRYSINPYSFHFFKYVWLESH